MFESTVPWCAATFYIQNLDSPATLSTQLVMHRQQPGGGLTLARRHTAASKAESK